MYTFVMLMKMMMCSSGHSEPTCEENTDCAQTPGSYVDEELAAAVITSALCLCIFDTGV